MDFEVERYCEFRSVPGYDVEGGRRKDCSVTIVGDCDAFGPIIYHCFCVLCASGLMNCSKKQPQRHRGCTEKSDLGKRHVCAECANNEFHEQPSRADSASSAEILS